MIFVDGAPLSSSSSSSRGCGTLDSLLQHPKLLSASSLFKALPERKVSSAEDLGSKSSTQKHVYVFQREYATVNPAFVEFVGTDEATTCVGLVFRNPKTGMTSVAHVDSPAVVDLGVNQMLAFVIDQNSDVELDVHLIGGFDDASPKCNNAMNGSESYSGSDGHSFPLCSRIVEALERRPEKCHIQTLCVLDHNTRRDSSGIAFPIVNGFLVETCSGSITPATFDRSSRCPDEIVRRIRVTVSFSDPAWKGRLLETYDTCNDRFQIAACSWSHRWKNIAFSLQQLPDSVLLLECSTSPFAESPDFVDNERRLFDYLIQHPNWSETFPMRKPRIFERNGDGGWVRC